MTAAGNRRIDLATGLMNCGVNDGAAWALADEILGANPGTRIDVVLRAHLLFRGDHGAQARAAVFVADFVGEPLL